MFAAYLLALAASATVGAWALPYKDEGYSRDPRGFETFLLELRNPTTSEVRFTLCLDDIAMSSGHEPDRPVSAYQAEWDSDTNGERVLYGATKCDSVTLRPGKKTWLTFYFRPESYFGLKRHVTMTTPLGRLEYDTMKKKPENSFELGDY